MPDEQRERVFTEAIPCATWTQLPQVETGRRMALVSEEGDAATLVGMWRDHVTRRGAHDVGGLDALEGRMHLQMTELRNDALEADEAFLIAVERLAATDVASLAFAREPLAGLWDEPPEKFAAAPEVTKAALARVGGRRGFVVMAVFACAAAIAIRLPEAFGFGLTDPADTGTFCGRNIGFLVLPALAGWFLWLRRPSVAGGFRTRCGLWGADGSGQRVPV